MNNMWTSDPYVQNQRIKRLTTAPIWKSREDVERYLSSPETSERELRETSWSLLGNTYPYYKMVKMYADILLYNTYAYPKYLPTGKAKTNDFKKEADFVYKYLDELNPQYTFRRIAMHTAIEGKSAYLIRDSFDKEKGNVDYVILQALPTDYWKITSKTQDSFYGIMFDFSYFWQPGTSIEQFPSFFKQIYAQLSQCISRNGNDIKITSKLFDSVIVEYSQSQGRYFLWVELPSDLCWCFSVDESNSWHAPTFMGMFLGLQDLNSYQYLQTQLASVPLYGMLTGTVPLHDNNRSGNHTNDFRITPEVYLGDEWRTESKLPSGIGAIFSPVENLKLQTFPETVNGTKIYNDAMQQNIATAGLSGILSTSEKPTVAMVKAAQKIESRYMDFMYRQFEHMMDTIFEDRLNLKYVWRTEVFGDIFSDKETRDDLANRVTGGHSYLLPKFLACYNLDLSSANSLADWVQSTEIYQKLTVPPTAYTAGGGDFGGGRPEMTDDQVDNENTALSREAGTNKIENRA